MALDGRSYSTIKVSNGITVKIEQRDSLTSTSALAKEYASHGYPDRYAVLTELQSDTTITKSKIRGGTFERGVFISLILRPSIFPSQAGMISPLSAVALAQALETYTNNKIGISWLTDIYCNGERIGGTQIEAKLNSASSYDYIIVSFAVKICEKHFPPRLKDAVKHIFEKDSISMGMMVAKTILDKFFNAYLKIRSPENHFKYYYDKFILRGTKIKYIVDGKKNYCTVMDVDPENFALKVSAKNKTFDIYKPSAVIIPKKLKPIRQNQKQ